MAYLRWGSIFPHPEKDKEGGTHFQQLLVFGSLSQVMAQIWAKCVNCRDTAAYRLKV
jgi:hypothetical protein